MKRVSNAVMVLIFANQRQSKPTLQRLMEAEKLAVDPSPLWMKRSRTQSCSIGDKSLIADSL